MNSAGDQTVDIEGKSFEDLLHLLDESVAILEKNELSLDEAISTYERSVLLAAACNRMLDQAELRIEQIESDALDAGLTSESERDAGDESVPF